MEKQIEKSEMIRKVAFLMLFFLAGFVAVCLIGSGFIGFTKLLLTLTHGGVAFVFFGLWLAIIAMLFLIAWVLD